MPALSNFANLPARAVKEYCRWPPHFETTHSLRANCEQIVKAQREVLRYGPVS